MEKFVNYSSVVIPIDRSNVDTDALIPKQFLKSVEKSGFGDNLFDEWRYLDQGEPGQDCSGRPLNADFVLNKKLIGGVEFFWHARILAAGLLENTPFGRCGILESEPLLREVTPTSSSTTALKMVFCRSLFPEPILTLCLPKMLSRAHARWISTSSAKRRRLNRDRFTVLKSMTSKSSAFWKVWTISH